MYFTPSHDENEESKLAESTSPIREDGSYEIVFDSKKESDSAYSVGGYNAYGFSANGTRADKTSTPPQEEKKPRRNKTPFFFTLAILLFVLSVILTGVNIALLIRSGNAPMPVTDGNTDTQSPDPWVNPAPIEGADVYATATEKVIHSVVVVNCDNSSGSGVVWTSDASISYILTCNHVIEGANDIRVTLYSGETYAAEVVGQDTRTDLALLKVSTPNLSSISLPHEDTALKLGQSVIAIGNPLGALGNSVSNGILSSLSRTVSIEGTTMTLIQTNAAVNSGNSGGGLFDMNGQLIGLVNAKVAESTVEGIGFAIPFDTLRTIGSELLDKGYVSGRPRLGISTVTVTSANYRSVLQSYPDLEGYILKNSFMGTSAISGVYVLDASAVAGYSEGSDRLQYGDRITGVGTATVGSPSDISSALNNYNAGETVQITVVRKNKTVIIELVLGEIGQ